MIGYTANEASADNISCINAFTMGAKMVNPKARVKVVYTGVWNSPKENAGHIQNLIELGADLITSKNTILDRGETSDIGITSMLCTVEHGQLKSFIAAPIWRWEVFYTKIVTSLLNGSYGRIVRANREKQLLNFWWGLETGGIDVYLNEAMIPTETLKLVKLMKQLIISEQFQIFQGPIQNNRLEMILEQDQVMAAEEIIAMDFYVDSVEIIKK